MYQPFNGWAEQNPQDWWTATYSSIKEVVVKSGVKSSEIKGIGLSGQMHGSPEVNDALLQVMLEVLK
jgi:xylulokinase